MVTRRCVFFQTHARTAVLPYANEKNGEVSFAYYNADRSCERARLEKNAASCEHGRMGQHFG